MQLVQLVQLDHCCGVVASPRYLGRREVLIRRRLAEGSIEL
jgi:hypothetical protein